MMNFNDNAPIYIQIANYMCERIERGSWAEGERISSVREFSSGIGVSPATCVRAYERLTAKGILSPERGMGYKVCYGACNKILMEARREFIENGVFDFIDQMKRFNLHIDDFVDAYNKY